MTSLSRADIDALVGEITNAAVGRSASKQAAITRLERALAAEFGGVPGRTEAAPDTLLTQRTVGDALACLTHSREAWARVDAELAEPAAAPEEAAAEPQEDAHEPQEGATDAQDPVEPTSPATAPATGPPRPRSAPPAPTPSRRR